MQRWKKQGIGEDRRAGPTRRPANQLSDAEERKILKLVNTPKYRDLPPQQIVPRLADEEGIYIASESTIYRLLRKNKQQKHREPSRTPTERHRPDELVATGPNQVWTWDITYLRSPVRGMFFYLYMMVDVWSRKVVGWTVEEEESALLAAAMIAAACDREGVERDRLSLHSDNGGPMKAATLLATLQVLGVATSFSRPRVSNDNPFSESLFRTTKYRPEFPRRPFASLEEARAWVTWFVQWYNEEHRHSAIRFVTPSQRHAGLDIAILAQRDELYQAARRRRPDRWTGNTRNWACVETVKLNPHPDQKASEAA